MQEDYGSKIIKAVKDIQLNLKYIRNCYKNQDCSPEENRCAAETAWDRIIEHNNEGPLTLEQMKKLVHEGI